MKRPKQYNENPIQFRIITDKQIQNKSKLDIKKTRNTHISKLKNEKMDTKTLKK